SLLCVFSHAQRIPRCECRIFVMEATQLPKQKQPLPVRQAVSQFLPSPFELFLKSWRLRKFKIIRPQILRNTLFYRSLSARLSSYSNVPLICPTGLLEKTFVNSFIRPQTYIRFLHPCSASGLRLIDCLSLRMGASRTSSWHAFVSRFRGCF